MKGLPRLLAIHAAIVAIARADVLDKYARGPGEAYHGRYTGNVREPELLIPRRVFEDGNFNTYSLPNFYDRREVVERKKRSLEAGGKGADAEDKLHLVLPFDGIDHHVELTPYHEFISPDMVVERRGAGISSDLERGLRFERASDRQCHYRGIVRGHEHSRAALSLCDGVAGYVQTDNGRYFVEPVKDAEPEPDGRHVHIAYKRHVPLENKEDTGTAPKRHCGTSDNWESAWAEQLAKREKRLSQQNALGTKRASPVSSGTHSIHRYIEIGLVADRRFLDFHNNTDYEQYLLTIMNMVSDFYHDGSAGNQIDVVVVRMIYLEKEKEEIDLLISPYAEDTLASFAKWAEKMNPEDHTHPNHYDIAVLVTRYDICSERVNCELMGLAYVGAACDPPKAACINEDSGLLLGIVVAHEVGHVYCPYVLSVLWAERGSSQVPSSFPRMERESEPSRVLFLLQDGLFARRVTDQRVPVSGQGREFLPHVPDRVHLHHQVVDVQQKIYDGFPRANDCSSLWCLTNSSCYSLGTPMADGTKCGENKGRAQSREYRVQNLRGWSNERAHIQWCIHKKCVDIGTRPAAVNGGWGQWGPMSGCSRTCGGGVKYSERECDKPLPANGGRYCIGERKRIFVCNTTPCDPTKPPYRAQQCSEYDNKEILTDGLHRWKPYSDSEVEPCALYCINEKHTFVKLSPTANDSTPCKAGTNYMCISGTCRRVGCDWILDSEAVDDKCGICKGDGTKCSPIEGEYTATVKASRYEKVVTIPKGARSIQVVEKKPSENTLAVRHDKENTYCLNANNNEQKSGDYECAGTMIIYTHPEPDREEIEMKGPIAVDIRIEYAFFNPSNNPGIRYKYYVASTDPSYAPKYIWDFIEWSECGAKCGGGTMISEATCVEEHGGKVSPSFCEGVPRPEPKSRICNQNPCTAKWRVSQWSKCSACDGKRGTRHRKVQCVKPGARPGEDDVQANFDACKGRVPRQKEECEGKPGVVALDGLGVLRTGPCKKTCPKSRRSSAREWRKAEGGSDLSPEDRNRMIDRFVEAGLARYFEKKFGGASAEERATKREEKEEEEEKEKEKEKEKEEEASHERPGIDREFRQILGDRSTRNEGKRRDGCTPEGKFTTPKPGSIVKDSVPVQKVVLMQAPLTEEFLRSNLSDKAFQEAGDLVGMGIDTRREKVYKGEQAVKMIEQLAHRNSSVAPRAARSRDSRAKDEPRGLLGDAKIRRGAE
ncbi:hypothetical protein KM043_004817 [Ampulex compressa]|nr:hypothetical protein KM043_004817 [Ampulex compressa]